MDVAEQSPAPTALPPLTKVPIAQVSPVLEELEEKCIHATVTLVWPYSSSTKSLSLLLSEPDFRLRRSNGQVKATFHGRVAEKIAKSQVGIGDTVRLALEGSAFVANDAATQTPGRCVAWDIHFESGVSVEITRCSEALPIVIIEQHIHAPHDSEPPPPSTPRVIEIDPASGAASGLGSWGSPAFLKSARSSYGGTLDTAYDPFTEEDGTVPGKGRKKPRCSLRREEWRILDEPDSPRERERTVDWDQAIEDELNTEQSTETTQETQPQIEISTHETVPIDNRVDTAGSVTDEPAVSVKPSFEQASSVSGRLAQQTDLAPPLTEPSARSVLGAASHLPTDTPQLHPIRSPGLPRPSPIISNHSNAQEYFSGFDAVPRTHTTENIATEINPAVDFVQNSQTIFSATQQQNVLAPPERPVIIQSQEVHHTGGHLTATDETILLDSMEIFHSRTLREHAVSNEPEFAMEVENRKLDVPVVEEDIAHGRVERKELSQEAAMEIEPEGELEPEAELEPVEEPQPGEELELEEELEAVQELEQEELEQEELEQEELEQEELVRENAESVSQHPLGELHEARHLDLNTTEIPQTEYPPARVLLDAADEQAAENEPEGYDLYQADDVEVMRMPPATRLNHLHGPDYSEDESHAAEDEALSDEEDAVEYTSQGDEEGYEEGEDESELDTDDVGLPQQPRPQGAQPEVIVLDSDSEDELASEQPAATPSRPVRREAQYEESIDHSNASSSDDEEEDWSAVDEEPGYNGVNSEDLAEDEERMCNSDLEDQSSVDVLARDEGPVEQAISGSRIMHENEDGEFSGEGPEGSPSVEDMQYDDKAGFAPEIAIDLSSDVEEASETEVAPVYDEDDRLRIAASASKAVDGTDDRDGAESLGEDRAGNSEREPLSVQEPAHQPWENLSVAQTSNGTPLLTSMPVSIRPGHEQLLTPDPTQKAVSGRQATPVKNEPAISPVLDAKGPSGSSGFPVRTSTHAAVEDRVVASDHDDMPSAAPSPEAPLDDLSALQQPHELIEADVAIPTTDSVPTSEQEKNDNLTAPQVLIVRKPPVPDRHAHGLRSKLSYFAPLATLVDHFNALVDTISVVHEMTPIAKATSASMDYYVTIQLTDPSMAGTSLQAQIFRRYKSALPSPVEGNVILLRNFKVRSYDHSIMLVSVESSAWAVFDGSSSEARINGPPVEYGAEERAYASGLRSWYREVGAAMVADNKLQAAVERDSMDRESMPSDIASSESGSMISVPRGDFIQSARSSRRSRKSHRRVTIHELRDGTRYTEVGSPSSRESIHELRDGTVYANL